MRLSKIKLAGFKSFVDPTTIGFPGSISCVVGPNGCGKSNVIDAVRWVMGESSAKHLRGDSMADVIFNGSTTRKPVGQAAIELVFDNSDGSAGGEYAQYNEISVRRQVSRDGASGYFLNGTRCRRRDITDLFLGTGLGARSYAIIEQGMITRLIEARPEELRVLLEEAAGISKYKERRRDTENRIRHTRENLERLSDLREELDKQLNHLQRQASTAEKYKTLRDEERVLEAQLMALRWRGLDAEAGTLEQDLRARENATEQVVAEQRGIEAELEKQRAAQSEANEAFNREQQAFYAIGADIARLEQSIQHAREMRQQQQRELEQLTHSSEEVSRRIALDEQRVEDVQRTLAELEPARQRAGEATDAAAAVVAEQEQQLRVWQEDWQQHSDRLSACRQAVEVEQTRLQQLEQQLADVLGRDERLASEVESLAGNELTTHVAEAQQAVDQHESDLKAQREKLERVLAELEQVREREVQTQSGLQSAHSELQEVNGRLASLHALQQAALGEDHDGVTQWLATQRLDKAERLARRLEVAPGWEAAVEAVLGASLEALCVDDVESVARALGKLESGTLTVVEPAAGGDAASDSLRRQVQGDERVAALLAGIYTAPDLPAALARRRQLAAGESVVTPEGIWLGANWLRVARDSDERAGMLAREQEIRTLEARREQLQQTVREGEEALAGLQQQLREAEQQREAAQRAVNEAHRGRSDAGARQQTLVSRQQQVAERQTAIAREREELAARVAELEQATREARSRLEQQLEELPRLESAGKERQQDRESHAAGLQHAREKLEADREHMHALDLKVQEQRAAEASARERLEQFAEQQAQMAHRRSELESATGQEEAPDGEAHTQLQTLLSQRTEVEARLTAARERLTEIDEGMRELEQRRLACERRVQEVRSELEDRRLASREIKVRQQTVRERAAEGGHEVEALAAELPADAEVGQWEKQVQRLGEQIARLGPINLAAIDEYTAQSERKEYLDRQDKDLCEALDTLEGAIRKIDRETRTRFKETFDKVNTGLQATFPRLFGGGHAYLELTGEDLLDTGVTIMARPPGKRNSNIHQLSGGEKALTAVALVFAIFDLNPAPFCMLDEVDAPLDDANVGRFCQLVQEMSQRVQFVVITHNKNTMEIANNLLGVTMSEPGVSRLVSVDVEEAAQMASG